VPVRPVALSLAAAATLALSACGEDRPAQEGESASTPARALVEISRTRDALQAALATYRRGDEAAAVEQVAEAYVQHFEHVEGPLGARDHELTEELEEAIGTELRAEMKASAPVARIRRLVRQIAAGLATAESRLK
jgi:hypothetical protein